MEKYYIYNSYLAKQLLNVGNPIIDLARDLKNKDRVIFVFEKTAKFKEDLCKFT